MEKTFEFGKIDYTGNGRKDNLVVIEMRFENGNFAASGEIWNSAHTDWITGGQCLDDIAEYIKTPLFEKIYRLWKLYHLNDMHAGTTRQENAIKDWEKQGNKYEYNAVCKMLKEKGLLYDTKYRIQGTPYRYGSMWLKREIPAKDKKIITQLLTA